MTPVVAITDPAAPIGRANARTYAEAGWNVALVGRGWEALEAAAADVRARGREALVVPVDLTDPSARALAIERIQAELGPIEAWASVADRRTPESPVARPRPLRRWRVDGELLPALAAGAVAASVAAAGVAVGYRALHHR
ncbi:MAG TPA: SDR family NAD(P)-dependent oxidoreductase [Candidatus Limnocylindrales bacterium]|nr:SDR family NAD(P)-dependent oxidoreductase [Candidatus Limnocylindrales bacterium]